MNKKYWCYKLSGQIIYMDSLASNVTIEFSESNSIESIEFVENYV